MSFFNFEALDGIGEVGDKSEAVRITIDRGAADSVCPKDWAGAFETNLAMLAKPNNMFAQVARRLTTSGTRRLP